MYYSYGKSVFADACPVKRPHHGATSHPVSGNLIFCNGQATALAAVDQLIPCPCHDDSLTADAVHIPDGASAYSFRHARISELLQIHSVDPLTVAHQTGTSIAMIERPYMRFIPAALLERLAALSTHHYISDLRVKARYHRLR